MPPQPLQWEFPLAKSSLRKRVPHHSPQWSRESEESNCILVVKLEQLLSHDCYGTKPTREQRDFMVLVPKAVGIIKLNFGSYDRKRRPEFNFQLAYQERARRVIIQWKCVEDGVPVERQAVLTFRKEADFNTLLRDFDGLGLQPKLLPESQLTARPPSSTGYSARPSSARFSHASFDQFPRDQSPHLSAQDSFQYRQGSVGPAYRPSSAVRSYRAGSVASHSQQRNFASFSRQSSIAPMSPMSYANGDEPSRPVAQHSLGPIYSNSDLRSTPRPGSGLQNVIENGEACAPAFSSESSSGYFPPSATSRDTFQSQPSTSYQALPTHSSRLEDENMNPVEEGWNSRRPSSRIDLDNELPPRRTLPFPTSSARSTPRITERSQQQSSSSSPQILPQTHSAGIITSEINKPTKPATKKAPSKTPSAEPKKQGRIVLRTTKRKHDDEVDIQDDKRQKQDVPPRPISTTPIPLPPIPSRPSSRLSPTKTIESAGLASGPGSANDSALAPFGPGGDGLGTDHDQNLSITSSTQPDVPNVTATISSSQCSSRVTRDPPEHDEYQTKTTQCSNLNGSQHCQAEHASPCTQPTAVRETEEVVAQPAAQPDVVVAQKPVPPKADDSELFITRSMLLWEATQTGEAGYRRWAKNPKSNDHGQQVVCDMMRNIEKSVAAAITCHGPTVLDPTLIEKLIAKMYMK